MATSENIYEEIRTLPEGQIVFLLFIIKVILFFLRTGQTVSRWWGESPSSIRSKRLALSQQAKGRFAHLPNSSDAFAQRKQAEIDWEDRHR